MWWEWQKWRWPENTAGRGSAGDKEGEGKGGGEAVEQDEQL